MLIVGIIATILGVISVILGWNVNDGECSTIFGGIAGILIMFGLAAIITSFEDPKPTPMDVYRGNTTLQITYQDSIPVDSVVVFKNK